MASEQKESLPPWLGWARLAIGLAQGIALHFLVDAREGMDPTLHASLWMPALFVPVVLVGGLGALRTITLIAWIAAAAAATAALAWYDVVRLGESGRQAWQPSELYFILPPLLFVAHHLIAAGDEARRLFAPYERYFDLGSRHAAQLLLAVLFTGAFWAVLALGAQMFNLIGIEFLVELIDETWFFFPATFGVFAAAIHLTDLRSGMVRGARALGLALLSWLLPAMTGLTTAFFVALLFTGLQPLWETRAATAILLGAAAALVVLVNAAYQDGVAQPGPILRWSARAASLLMTPLAVLAAYALYLRIEQHGLTPERIFALAVLAVGACYVIAYLVGAFWPRWMKPLEAGNVASAFLALAVAISLFSPIADPARISVADQMRRLETGAVSPANFDVTFLRFDGASYGLEALRRLRDDRSTVERARLAQRASNALQAQDRWDPNLDQPRSALELTVYPDGAELPETFVMQRDMIGAAQMCGMGGRAVQCEAFMFDVNGDGDAEIIVGAVHGPISVYDDGEGGHWRVIASGARPPELNLRDAFQRGRVRMVTPRIGDLEIGDVRIPLSESPTALQAEVGRVVVEE
jgi:hypothetical protein